VSHFTAERMSEARQLVSLYPDRRSALIPLCHLAQEQDGWLCPEAMEEIAQLVGIEPAEVRGTATFYDMLYTEPVGRFLISICTNIACLLGGAMELVEHAESTLGVRVGGTTEDGMFTLEEAECLADCDRTPCVQVNHRFVGGPSPGEFDQLIEELRAGERADEIPPHGTLVRVRRSGGLRVDRSQVAEERAAMAAASEARAADRSGGGAGGGSAGGGGAGGGGG
jgi:NADH-quinone oxidoreductase subunit E